ncbi:class I SAM-dependent methyltransferase [Thermobifida halotolerans]|uniref:Class I SAM-dependent methyltransferase n=1 Tax=Thermobifida halotolerans TaxID=483545 RepID=A0AA97M031_9ACTN|nr:class I SAM-dependent methyltransferase [Thermobifida halotolerans]UOE20955.1 class I SAM-dependent methyltransferase [Thermobifida halotolerans]
MPESPRRLFSASPDPGLYRPFSLRWLYTPYVIGFSHRLARGVPNTVPHILHRETVGPVHVEVGPGNGHFPARLPHDRPIRALHLLDHRSGPLQVCRRRSGDRWPVRAHRADVLDAWPVPESHADSVTASMVVRALPGQGIGAKAALFDQAARALRPGGLFTGATILTRGVAPNRLARRLMSHYNTRGWFAHGGDSLADLDLALAERSTGVRVDVHGCAALWRGEAR